MQSRKRCGSFGFNMAEVSADNHIYKIYQLFTEMAIRGRGYHAATLSGEGADRRRWRMQGGGRRESYEQTRLRRNPSHLVLLMCHISQAKTENGHKGNRSLRRLRLAY